ncbi:hypothetical protein [Flavicella sp.]|uniref:hypothetical protein n=1 Tax=Flavicella sp. TaxID=2957742 RepID=UPI0026276527|nr:hypothetical protein [Flavicella sp.]MDG1805667.1 hypothetical protein [Flavicella sp.]
MKKITFIIIALVATNFYAQQNEISKGDFEENPAPVVGNTYVENGWYYRDGGSRFPVEFSTDDFSQGSQSGKFLNSRKGSAKTRRICK